VPRARPFTRAEITHRQSTKQVDPALITLLAQKASIDQKLHGRFGHELCVAIWKYRAHRMAHSQERPARIISTLRRGIEHARKLSSWLNSVPPSLRQDLQAAEMEGLLSCLTVLLDTLTSNAEARSTYWQRHVEKHRPFGDGEIGKWLRQDLADIILSCGPDDATANERKQRANERRRRHWVEFAVEQIGATYPSAKKNRRKFTGERAREAPIAPSAIGTKTKTRGSAPKAQMK
jgi:hypothetical protein